MKKLKKMAAFITAAALSMTAGSTVFADTIGPESGSTDPKPVTGTYVQGSSSKTIYSVDVAWGEMQFTYTAPAQGQWNPADHQYDSTTGVGTWTCDDGAGDITVTNHSNTEISATVSFTAAAGFSKVTGSFDSDTITLADASVKALGNRDAADSKTVTLSLSGDPDQPFTGVATVGEVKVTIADAAATK